MNGQGGYNVAVEEGCCVQEFGNNRVREGRRTTWMRAVLMLGYQTFTAGAFLSIINTNILLSLSTLAIGFSSYSSVCGVSRWWSVFKTSIPCTDTHCRPQAPTDRLDPLHQQTSNSLPRVTLDQLLQALALIGDRIKLPSYIIVCPPIRSYSFARLGRLMGQHANAVGGIDQ